MRRSRGLILMASLAVSTLSACSITFGEARTSEEPPPVTPTASGPQSTDGPAPSISAPGRLAVLESDGSLYTIEADGSDRAELIAAEGEALTALQPAWAPGGERLAWVISEPRGGAIVVAGPRGEDPVVTPTPFVPYYLSWSPTGDRVAFLGPGADPEAPVQMGVLELEGDEPQVRPVAGGKPFLYFAWAPDGRRVLAHAGFDRLEEIDLEGRSTPVTTRPGLFAAPAWSDDGHTLIYAERGPNGVQRLVAVVDEGRPETLVEGDGALSFVMRPDGQAVAYQMLDERDGDLFDRRPTESGDGVRVIDLRTGIERRATRIRAMTFWWSPNGERLLALAPEPESTDAIPFLWQIWDGRRVIDVPGSHFPTLELMRDYAPFFTQYSQSATPWSPDGSAFAFPVLDPDGSGQIVVQQIGGEPSVIGDGVYVTWSP